MRPVGSRDPVLPIRPGSAIGGQSGSRISYAEKALGGMTTSRPLIPKQPGAQTGPTGSTTEQEAKEEQSGPRDNELREFSESLLKKDVNNAFKHVKINVQGKTTSQSKNDEAPQK